MRLRNCLLCLLMLLIMAGALQAAPHLSIKDPHFNFGIVPQHAKVSHTFWLYNDGTDTLRITKIVPG